MLITFSSNAAADVLMLSEHALPLLHAAGKHFDGSLPDRGVFTKEQLPSAIEGLETLVRGAPAVADEDEDDDAPPVPAMERAVSLRQRAFPLIDLMRRAHASGDNVMWESSSPY